MELSGFDCPQVKILCPQMKPLTDGAQVSHIHSLAIDVNFVIFCVAGVRRSGGARVFLQDCVVQLFERCNNLIVEARRSVARGLNK